MTRRVDDRKADFKKGADSESGHRMREAAAHIQIHKANKDEQLAKRHNISKQSDLSPAGEKKLPTSAEVPWVVQALQNPSAGKIARLEAVRMARRMLSVEDNPPVKQIIDSGLVFIFVGALTCDDDPALQFQAAWALTNIAATTFTNVVVEAGPIPGLVRLLECPHAEVREQAVWCLGNIAGDCPKFRNMILNARALPSILKNIQQWDNDSLVGNMVWTISNLCRGKPQPSITRLRSCIPALSYVISHTNDNSIIVDATWALSYLSDGDDDRIDHVVRVIPLLITLLESDSTSSVLLPALRTLGNIVSGNMRQTQMVLDAGILQHASRLLQSPRQSIRKEICWLLSNIAAGTATQSALLFKAPYVMSTVVEYARSAPWEVKKEALWTLSNAFVDGDHIQVQRLVDHDGIDALCEALDINDTGIKYRVLDAIEHLIRVGDVHGKDYRVFVDECNGIDKIEFLQHDTSDKIYEKVVKIINELFGGDDHMFPSSDLDAYVFGIPSKNLFGSPE